tara:strand:- start:290 stop:469 length:180 start_codon:yes stop_codon:yes gene_type:complete
MKVGDLVYCRNNNIGFESAGVILKASDGGYSFEIHTFKDNEIGTWTLGFIRPWPWPKWR